VTFLIFFQKIKKNQKIKKKIKKLKKQILKKKIQKNHRLTRGTLTNGVSQLRLKGT